MLQETVGRITKKRVDCEESKFENELRLLGCVFIFNEFILSKNWTGFGTVLCNLVSKRLPEGHRAYSLASFFINHSIIE